MPYLEKEVLPTQQTNQNIETELSLIIRTKGQNVEKHKDTRKVFVGQWLGFTIRVIQRRKIEVNK